MPPIFSDAKDAVQVVSIDPDTQEFTLNEDALKAILLSEDVANLPVVVVSVAGCPTVLRLNAPCYVTVRSS